MSTQPTNHLDRLRRELEGLREQGKRDVFVALDVASALRAWNAATKAARQDKWGGELPWIEWKEAIHRCKREPYPPAEGVRRLKSLDDVIEAVGLAVLTHGRLVRTFRAPDTTHADGPAPDEITCAQAALDYDVPKSALSKAARKEPNEAGYLPTRKIGRHRYVKQAVAKRFADDYEARREQRLVGSKSGDDAVVSALKKVQEEGKKRRRSNAK